MRSEIADPNIPTALFFHGLNTFKDDLLHLGPVNLGRMDRHLKPALETRGIRIHSIDGIGFSSPESQARHACTQITNGFGLRDGSHVSFLGNSMGGLVTRALAHLWMHEPSLNPRRLKIDKLISWGTPHAGSPAAEWFFTRNHETFRHYSSTSVQKFNERYPLGAYAPEFYFLCSATWRDVSPYFWGVHTLMNGLTTAAVSDGFMHAESQKWGECRGTFVLDHFGQTGFDSILPLPSQRSRSRHEFSKLCDRMAELVKNA